MELNTKQSFVSNQKQLCSERTDKNYNVIEFTCRKRSKYLMNYTFVNQRVEKKSENSDIIDKFILRLKVLNVNIPVAQYNNIYIYIYI